MSASVGLSPTNRSRRGEMLVHEGQRRLARPRAWRKLGALQVIEIVLADEGQPEAQRRQIGL